MRAKLEEILLRAVRLYTFNTPVRKGKYRAFLTALGCCRVPHTAMPVKLRDGRRFVADLTTGMENTLYFLGEYEPAISRITSALVESGDVCVDVGANFGWYTILMAAQCGPAGQVHAFEPVPSIYAELEGNVALNRRLSPVFLNQLALADREATKEIHTFADIPSGHASFSPGRSIVAETLACEVAPLDHYLETHEVTHVDFLKVDIEGAEMMFLEGASRLFNQPEPPIILMEMARETTEHFGYLPDALVKYIAEHGDYEFYAVDEERGTVYEIEDFGPNDIGANVFCMPRVSRRRELIRRFLA